MDADHHDPGTSFPELVAESANYLVIPRAFLDGMPDEWRAATRALFARLALGYADVYEPYGYKLEARDPVQVDQLTGAQREALGITVSTDCLKDHLHVFDDPCEFGQAYTDADGRRLTPSSLVFVTVEDPTASYAGVKPSFDEPVDQAVLIDHVRQIGDIAAYLDGLIVDARNAAATMRIDPGLSAAISQLAPQLRAGLLAWLSLVEVADGL